MNTGNTYSLHKLWVLLIRWACHVICPCFPISHFFSGRWRLRLHSGQLHGCSSKSHLMWTWPWYQVTNSLLPLQIFISPHVLRLLAQLTVSDCDQYWNPRSKQLRWLCGEDQSWHLVHLKRRERCTRTHHQGNSNSNWPLLHLNQNSLLICVRNSGESSVKPVRFMSFPEWRWRLRP